MNFRQIIIKYGHPMIRKEVAGCVYGARRYVEKLAEQERNADSGGIIPNYSYMADLVDIDRREDRENEAYKSLSRGGIPSTDIKTPVRYLILQGKYPHKENGVETSEYSKMYNKERYKLYFEGFLCQRIDKLSQTYKETILAQKPVHLQNISFLL